MSITTTDRKVSRMTTGSYNVLRHGYKHAREIIITIDRDMIGFREKRTRNTYWLAADDGFRFAVRQEAARVKAEKKKGKK